MRLATGKPRILRTAELSRERHSSFSIGDGSINVGKSTHDRELGPRRAQMIERPMHVWLIRSRGTEVEG
jgi:hypothetical protein